MVDQKIPINMWHTVHKTHDLARFNCMGVTKTWRLSDFNAGITAKIND